MIKAAMMKGLIELIVVEAVDRSESVSLFMIVNKNE